MRGRKTFFILGIVCAIQSINAQVVLEHDNDSFLGVFYNCENKEYVDFGGTLSLISNGKSNYEILIQGLGIGRDSEVVYEVFQSEDLTINGSHTVLMAPIELESQKKGISSLSIKLMAYCKISPEGKLIINFLRVGKQLDCQDPEFLNR